MSNEYTLKITSVQAKEMPMVDLAFAVLKAANTPFYYRDLMTEIAKIKGLSDKEVMNVIAQLYTEINIDGRFACVGTNLWGLKRWYPIEKSDDAIGNSKRPRIINDDDDLDDDPFTEEEELYLEEDDFGKFASKDDFEEIEASDDAEFIDEPLVEEVIEDADDLDEDDEDDEEDSMIDELSDDLDSELIDPLDDIAEDSLEDKVTDEEDDVEVVEVDRQKIQKNKKKK